MGKQIEIYKTNNFETDWKIKNINQSWLFIPEELKEINSSLGDEWSNQVANQIALLSEGHMLDYSAKSALADILAGQSMILTDYKQEKVVSYVKASIWSNFKGIAGWEIGSLFVQPQIQGIGLGKFMVKTLVKQPFLIKVKEPIFAVVTEDNIASIKLFQGLDWQEDIPEAEATANYNYYSVNGVNIFEDWGIPSSVFYKPNY